MKTADHITPIRGAALRVMKSDMGAKRDRWIGPMVVLAFVATALLVVLV